MKKEYKKISGHGIREDGSKYSIEMEFLATASSKEEAIAGAHVKISGNPNSEELKYMTNMIGRQIEFFLKGDVALSVFKDKKPAIKKKKIGG